MSGFILYRQYDRAGNLLYIGVSLTFFGRLASHKLTSHWFNDVSKIELQKFKSLSALLRAEKRAIKKEKPKYNVHYSDLDRGEKHPVLNLEKLADRMEVSRRTLYNMIEDGRFPVKPIKGTKPRLWDADTVDAWRAGK